MCKFLDFVKSQFYSLMIRITIYTRKGAFLPLFLPYRVRIIKGIIIYKCEQGDLNSHRVAPNRFSYHHSFHYPFGLWSGLSLHHTFQFRCSPSSLYTFKISLAWLGITILQVSPNLRNYTHKVSQIRLNFHKSGVSTDSTILA